MRKFVLCVVLVWSFVGNGSEVEVPFTDFSFEQALEKSQSLQKMVFVNFYTDWCAPCKLMDQTTFKDAKVLDWLEAHAIPVSIDAEERTNLADRYFVRSYPTYLFITPTGATLDVVVGYKKENEFISIGEEVLNGQTSIKKARDALSGDNHEDPMLREDLAGTYVIWGRYEDALREFLWCFDEGHIVDPAYVGVRGSFLLSDIADLAKVYPPAREALKVRRDAFLDKILNERNDTDITTYTSINLKLGETEKTIQLYENLIRDKQDRSHAIRWVVEANIDLFVEHKRYDVIVSNVDLVLMARRHIEMLDNSDALLEGVEPMTPEIDEARQEGRRMFLQMVLAKYYLVFIATSQEEEAQEVASLLLANVDDAAAYHALAEAGLKSEVPITENVQQAEKAVSMDPENASFVNTYAQLLHATGRKEQATTTLSELLKSDVTAREREMIQESLRLFGVEE